MWGAQCWGARQRQPAPAPGSGVNRGNIRWWLGWALHDQPWRSALSKILSYNQRVCYSPFYWWQPLIQETQRGQLHSAKLSRLSTGWLLLKRDEQSSDRINGRIKKTNETSISFLKLLRNITVECRAMKDLLYSVNILTKYQVLGLFKCIFRKPRNFLCNMKLGSRVVAVSSS